MIGESDSCCGEEIRYKEECWVAGRGRTLAASLVVARAGYS